MDVHIFLLICAVLFEVAVVAALSVMLVSGFISSVHGAPYVPITKKRVGPLLAFGELRSGEIFYDLGSGDGRLLFVAVKDFHVAKAVGYEGAPWPYAKSKFLLRRSGLSNIEIRNQNFFDVNLSEATCIYMYLMPKLIDKLTPKLAMELKSGTRLICPSFPIDTQKHPQFRLKKEQKIGSITAFLYEKI